MKNTHLNQRSLRVAGGIVLAYLSAAVVLAAGSISVTQFRLLKKANLVMDGIESRSYDIEVSLKSEASNLEAIEAGIQRGEDQNALRAALQSSAEKIKANSQEVQLSSSEAGMVRSMLDNAKAMADQLRDRRFDAALDRAIKRIDAIVSNIVTEKKDVRTLMAKVDELAKKIDQM